MKTAQHVWSRENGWQEVVKPEFEMDKAQWVWVIGDREELKKKEWVDQVRKWYPSAKLVGGSSSGSISGIRVSDETIVVTGVWLEKSRIEMVHVEVEGMDKSQSLGEKLAGELPHEGLRHVIVVSDGLNVNGSSLVKGLNESLPEGVAVTGGLAGDQDKFEETVVVVDGEVETKQVVAVGLYGNDLKVGYGSMGGWDPFGVVRMVTKSEGNVLYELDGQPALELYKTYLGEDAKNLPGSALLFPLNLIQEGSDPLVRTVLAVDDEKGSMTFAGDLPKGSKVQLMRSNFERLIDGADGAAGMTREGMGEFQAQLILLVSCVGRKLVLKQRVEEELEAVKGRLGEVTMTGYYSYGEICPTASTEKQCQLHNQTMTVTTLAEG